MKTRTGMRCSPGAGSHPPGKERGARDPGKTVGARLSVKSPSAFFTSAAVGLSLEQSVRMSRILDQGGMK